MKANCPTCKQKAAYLQEKQTANRTAAKQYAIENKTTTATYKDATGWKFGALAAVTAAGYAVAEVVSQHP